MNYFGPGQGGGVDANIERWKGQVLGADGKPAPPRSTSAPGAACRLRSYRQHRVPTPAWAARWSGGKPVPGYRLIGAIVEGPGGSVFFKLTGPAKTIAAQQKNFEQLLASIQPDK